MAESHRIDPEGLPYAPEKHPAKEEVGADGFAAVDLRVGRVLAAEPFPEARRPALKLTVDFGPVLGVLTTSAKVTNYRPEELVGRQVVGVVNIGTRRVAGFASRFLVLGGLAADGTVHLLAPDLELPPGSIVA